MYGQNVFVCIYTEKFVLFIGMSYDDLTVRIHIASKSLLFAVVHVCRRYCIVTVCSVYMIGSRLLTCSSH